MFQLILVLFLALALAIFAVQNTAPTQLQFLWWKTQNFSLAVVVILSAILGAILCFFLSIPAHHRKHLQLKKRERELQELRDAISKQ